MINNSYAHTIRVSDFSLDDIGLLYEIMNSGYLLSRNNLIKKGIIVPSRIITKDTSVFNGMDYISLCDMQKNHELYSSYNMYVKNGLSLLFSHDINVLKPTIIDSLGRSLENIYNMHNLGLKKERYSDLTDEVQVKDKLSLDNLVGLSLSKKRFLMSRNYEYLIAYIEMVNEVLNEYYPSLFVYNLDDGKVLSKMY